jgi:hypothetical protein
MGLGDDIKAAVDDVRDSLGLDCTLNGTQALGHCAYHDLNPASVRDVLGDDYQDELNLRWAMIEVPVGAWTVGEQDKITVDLTSESWIVRRVIVAQAAGVKIADRCICHRQLGADPIVNVPV